MNKCYLCDKELASTGDAGYLCSECQRTNINKTGDLIRSVSYERDALRAENEWLRQKCELGFRAFVAGGNLAKNHSKIMRDLMSALEEETAERERWERRTYEMQDNINALTKELDGYGRKA